MVGEGFYRMDQRSKSQATVPGALPHFSGELGFYDLRLSESREAQAELAKAHGISGFCYYHYWFKGRRLLGRPIDELLRSDRPDFPFCLCWANESWTRRWLGEEREVLIPQTYDEHDDLEHCHWLAKTFADRRYMRIRGRAIFLIYRPGNLPEPRRVTDKLRDVCWKSGDKDPYLIGVDAHRLGRDFRSDGFDTTLEFEPQLGVLPGAFDDNFSLQKLRRNLRLGVTSGNLKVYDYAEARDRMLMSYARPFPTVPCVFVRWDNTPRRGKNGVIIVNSSPQAFGRALETTVSKLRANCDGEPMLFINAWNEWAEGNHLEPCQKWGRGYLEAVRKALGTPENRRLEHGSR
jgi:lipopolysaccharide biosynthesis protein